jgi:hypothetical protein
MYFYFILFYLIIISNIMSKDLDLDEEKNQDFNLNPINDDDVSENILGPDRLNKFDKAPLRNIEPQSNTKSDPSLDIKPEETDEAPLQNMGEYNETSKAQPVTSTNIDLDLKNNLEETQTFTCSSFYDELKNVDKNIHITEYKDLNFDSFENTLISDFVNEQLKNEYLKIEKEDMDIFINNNGKIFTTQDFEHPIFQKIFTLLPLEIVFNKLILNDKIILDTGIFLETGEKIGRHSNWAVTTFTPNLLSDYTTKYQEIFDPETFNRIFIQILFTLLLDYDFLKISEQLTNYDILPTGLSIINKPNVKKYIEENSEKLSILFNIPEEKLEENICDTATVNIKFDSKNVIITKSSTQIQESIIDNTNYIIGLSLLKSTYNLIENEKKLFVITRYYVSKNDKITYKNKIINELIERKKQDKYRINLLKFLNCIQEKTNIENICDDTLNTFFNDLKTNKHIQEHFSKYKGNTIEIIKYPKFNFDILLKQKIHEYLKNEFFRLITGVEEDFDDYLSSISDKCIEPHFAREIYNNGAQRAANGGENSRIFNIIKTLSKELVVNTEITVNDEIIFDSYTSKNENGEKIGRANSIDYYLDILFPYLLEKYKQNYNNSDCHKFNEGFITLIFLLSVLETSSLVVQSFIEIVYPSMTDYAPQVKFSPIVYEVIGFPDGRPGALTDYNGVKTYIEKNINKISESFGISIETLNSILPHNKLKINITQDNIIINRTMVYGIIIQNILPNAEYDYKLLGLMISSEDFNFKNNTHDISCKVRWFPDNLLIKEVMTRLNNNILSADEEVTQSIKKIISYYRCINLNGLSPEEVDNINSEVENNEWLDIMSNINSDTTAGISADTTTDINLTKTEKIKKKWNKFEEAHPNVARGAKFMGETVGTAGVVAGVSAAVLSSMGLLSAVIGGKKSKKNMKRRNKKRVTRNNKKQNARKNVKRTRKGLKKVKKIRNTKKQRLGKE